MEVLRLENISKHFEGLQALRNIYFNITEGERWGIIGPNGSGKTTLLNVISGVLRPSSGKVYLYGKEVTHEPLHAFAHFGVARTFQMNTLFLPLTVLDNISLAIQGTQPYRYSMVRPLSGYSALFAQAEEILHQWDLWDKRELPVADLSYGEQRCLELVLGLPSNPRVILLDEPTAGLSAQEIALFTKVIRDLQTKITTIIVEHNIEALFELSANIIVLDHGEIIAKGDKEVVRNDGRVREVYLGSKR